MKPIAPLTRDQLYSPLQRQKARHNHFTQEWCDTWENCLGRADKAQEFNKEREAAIAAGCMCETCRDYQGCLRIPGVW